MLKVALTGGIASGKTTVANLFRQRGVEVIDTDRLAREAVQQGQPALEEIHQEFGDAVMNIDGGLDRAALRERIFANAKDRATLNAILHPRIINMLDTELSGLSGQPYVIIEIPLLVEGGFEKDFDRVLVVDTPPSLQARRLEERDGVSPDAAKQAIAAQADRNERLAQADDIIVNDGPIEALAAEVDRLDARYREFASKANAASE